MFDSDVVPNACSKCLSKVVIVIVDHSFFNWVNGTEFSQNDVTLQ